MTKTLIAAAALAWIAAATVALTQPNPAESTVDASTITGAAAAATPATYRLPTMTITARRLSAEEVATIRASERAASKVSYVLPTMTITAPRLSAEEVAATRSTSEVAYLPTMTITAPLLSAEEVAAIRAGVHHAELAAN